MQKMLEFNKQAVRDCDAAITKLSFKLGEVKRGNGFAKEREIRNLENQIQNYQVAKLNALDAVTLAEGLIRNDRSMKEVMADLMLSKWDAIQQPKSDEELSVSKRMERMRKEMESELNNKALA